MSKDQTHDDLTWCRADYPIDLVEILKNTDFSNPETVAKAYLDMAEGSIGSNHPVIKANGLTLKYMAESMSCIVADAKRHNVSPGELASGMCNALGIMMAFLAMNLTADEDEFNEIREKLADTVRESMYAFAVPHPESGMIKGMPKYGSDKNAGSVPSIPMRIDEPGTVH
jgi:hypothetical protein